MDQYHRPLSGSGELKQITMIETPLYDEGTDVLLSLNYTNANKTSPEFSTKYKSTEQMAEINFSILILRLHQEGLKEILQFANNFQQKSDRILKTKASGDRIASAGPPLATIDEGEENDEDVDKEKVDKTVVRSASGVKKGVPVVDSIKIKLIAQMSQVAIELENEKRPITRLKVRI